MAHFTQLTNALLNHDYKQCPCELFVKNLVDEKREEVRKVNENRMPVNEVNKILDQRDAALEEINALKAKVAELTCEPAKEDEAKEEVGEEQVAQEAEPEE